VEGALLALGYAVGGLVYIAVAAWAWRAARVLAAGVLGVYWRRRARVELLELDRRVASVNAPPKRTDARAA
jgi:hypothetical protein